MGIETEVVNAYFDAWNAQDTKAILDMFSDDGTYSDPVGGQNLPGQVYADYANL